MMMAAVGRLFDQYSVICVFGSVVGCVVVPLITQSMETLIFSAIVMTLTAKTLGQRILALRQDTQTRDDTRRTRDPTHEKKTKRKKIVQTQPPLSTDLQQRRHEDIKKQEELRQAEKERRVEEKKEKRARKKEERCKRKEEEKREREREEQLRRERQEQRAQKKQEKERRTFGIHFPMVESLSQIEFLSHQRPIQHERKHSSSSSTSTSSTRSRSHSHPHRGRYPHRHPVRASSDPLLPSPPSPTYHNSPAPSPPPTTRAWMTPSLPQAPLNWLSPTHSNQPMQRVNSDSSPSSGDSHLQRQQQLIGHAMQYPNPTWFAQAPPGIFWPQGATLVHPELVESRQQMAWVPAAMATTPLDMLRYASMNTVLNTINGGNPSNVYAGDFPQEGYYSLFSNSGQSPFGTALLSSNTSNSDPDPSPSPDANLEPEPDPKGTEPVRPESPPRRECDDWPSL